MVSSTWHIDSNPAIANRIDDIHRRINHEAAHPDQPVEVMGINSVADGTGGIISSICDGCTGPNAVSIDIKVTGKVQGIIEDHIFHSINIKANFKAVTAECREHLEVSRINNNIHRTENRACRIGRCNGKVTIMECGHTFGIYLRLSYWQCDLLNSIRKPDYLTSINDLMVIESQDIRKCIICHNAWDVVKDNLIKGRVTVNDLYYTG